MTECPQNCRFFRTTISNYLSKVKLKLIENSEDFFAPD